MDNLFVKNEIIIRKLKSIEDFKKCQITQKKAWGFNDIDVIPVHFQKAFSEFAIQIGIFKKNLLIGIALCYPTSNPDTFIFHMMAILEEFRGVGLAKILVKFVFEELKNRKINNLIWTYDLFDFRNSNFYLNNLNAAIFKAEKNYYGELNSDTHKGLPSHRVFCKISLNDPPIFSGEEKLIKIDFNAKELREKELSISIKLIDTAFEEIEKYLLLGYLGVSFNIETRELLLKKTFK